MKRPLTIVVGTRKISRQNLPALTEGAVIALEEDADAPVTIAWDGTVIGKGKLVCVDGKLAVRISTLEFTRTGVEDEV